jgi:hypothetical protein
MHENPGWETFVSFDVTSLFSKFSADEAVKVFFRITLWHVGAAGYMYETCLSSGSGYILQKRDRMTMESQLSTAVILETV